MRVEEESETISKAAYFELERMVAEICDLAKVDYDLRPVRARQLLNQLENYFREALAAGRTEEVALADAMRKLGMPSVVARSLRGGFRGWVRRLHTFYRYRPARYIVIVVAGLMVEWFRITGSLSISDVTPTGFQVQFMFYGANVFAGALIVGFTALAFSALAARFAVLRFACCGMALLIFGKVATSWWGALSRTVLESDESAFDYSLIACLIALLPLLALAFTCWLAEVLEWPKNKSRPAEYA